MVLNADIDGMTPADFRVAMYLYARSEADCTVHVARPKVAADLRLGRNTVDRAFRRLVDLEWLLLENTGGPDRRGARNKYALVIPPRHALQ